MRVLVLGGTRFIGVATVEELVSHGHQVAVFHTGRSESDRSAPVEHVHGDRRDVAALQSAIDQTGAEALVDTCAYSRADVVAVLQALPPSMRTVVLSSQDVYRAFDTMRRAAAATDPVPVDESSPVRGTDQRYLFRGTPAPPGVAVDPDTYENLDVEEGYRAVGATVLRLPAVYGERDYVRREEPLLGRLRAGRRRIPIGAGNLLWSRGYVGDVAGAIRLALECDAAVGQVFNIAEARTWTMEQWAARVLAMAASDAELVRVPDPLVAEDLGLTRAFPQHLLVSSAKARQTLGWSDTDPDAALGRSVAWYLGHPPADTPGDFEADDRALEAVG
jgi:nucleoside-diphosphate-sugar epimerase